MRDLVNKLIENAHVLLLLYGLYGTWVSYDEHSLQMEELTNREVSAQAEIGPLEQKVAAIQDFAKKTEEYKARVEEVAKNIETVQRQLPAETNDSSILSYFQQEIGALNLKDADFKPGLEATSTYFISKDYSLKAKGTFLQFLIFFERIAGADRIYNIKNLKLSNDNAAQRGRFQMISGEGTIQAFRFNPSFRVDRGITE